MEQKLTEAAPPPPPPPIPLFFSHKDLSFKQRLKHKKFHWKLSQQQNNLNLYGLGLLTPLRISEDLQILLFELFPAMQVAKDSKIPKISNINLESGLYNNIRLIQIQCLTSWKKFTLKDVLSDVLKCEKCWEEQITVFLSLKFDNNDKNYDSKNESLDNIDCVEFLKILSAMESYLGLRCYSTICLLETADQLNNFDVFLTALISMNDLVSKNVDVLKTLLEIILGITLYLNNMLDLPKNKTFCISNLCRLKYFKSSNKKVKMKNEVDKTQSLSLLDVVGDILKDDIAIKRFLNIVLETRLVKVEDINVLYEQIIGNMEKILQFSKEVNQWNYVNNDKFEAYFCSKIKTIMATFNILQQKYNQAMKQYYVFVCCFETRTAIKVENHINDFNGSSFEYIIFDPQFEKVELFQILETFLKELMLVQEFNIQALELKQSKNSFVIERKNEYEKMLNELSSISRCPSSENLRRLREISCCKRPTNLMPKSTYGVDAKALALLERTREI